VSNPYEGRPLPRPQDDAVDQGLGFGADGGPDQAGIADASSAIATSQVALPKTACDQVYARSGYQASVANLARLSLADDNVFGDDGGARQLATTTGDPGAGFTVALAVPVDTTTAPSAGGGPGGGPPPRTSG
jgi:hypothetical protein